LSLDTRKDELEWVWEIPLSADRQSVGLVMPTDAFKALDRRGRTLGEVFVEGLGRFSRYAHLEPDLVEHVYTRTYRPYVSTRVTGANWLMVGEAAAMIDPLTSIGVTAALRTGSEAASIIEQADGHATRGGRALADYDRRVRCIGDTYNAAIERLIYQPQARRELGLRAAGLAYVLAGYGTNMLYTRLQPTTTVKTTVLAALASGHRIWTSAWLAAAGAASLRSWTRAEKG
jgi:2-polyprenyl-6-methoxyphenol hydroxylase-like FAD-dependent oxidoreductase